MISPKQVGSIKRLFNDAINSFGRNITLHYHTVEQCSACVIDPNSGQSMNSNCPSCRGRGLIYTDKAKTFQGVTRNFLGSLSSYDSKRNRPMWMPIGDSRITCELQPFLKDSYAPTGATILDDADYVEFDGKKYKVKRHDTTNINDFYIVVITLDDFSGNDVKL